MKTIILNVEDLKDRAQKLRFIRGQYVDCQAKLNSCMNHLYDVYKQKGESMILEEMNLYESMNAMMEKLTKLANILEERALEIENARHD